MTTSSVDEQDGGLGRRLVAADELGRAVLARPATEVGAVGVAARRRLAGRPWPACCCSAIADVEPVDVDLDAALGGDLLGDLEREAVGVVEQERDRVAGRAARPRPARRARSSRMADPVRRVSRKRTSSRSTTSRMNVVVLDQLGIVGAHDLDDRRRPCRP